MHIWSFASSCPSSPTSVRFVRLVLCIWVCIGEVKSGGGRSVSLPHPFFSLSLSLAPFPAVKCVRVWMSRHSRSLYHHPKALSPFSPPILSLLSLTLSLVALTLPKDIQHIDHEHLHNLRYILNTRDATHSFGRLVCLLPISLWAVIYGHWASLLFRHCKLETMERQQHTLLREQNKRKIRIMVLMVVHPILQGQEEANTRIDISCHNNNITNKCTEENDLEGSRIWILPSSSFVFVDVYFVNCKPASLFPLDLTLQSFLLLLTRLDYNGLRGKARASLVAQHGERIGWQIDRKKETEKLWEMSNMTTMGVWEAPTTPYYKVWTSPRDGGPIPMCNWRRKIWPDVFFICLCVQLSSLFVVGCTHWCARHFLMVCLYGSLLRCERMESPGATSQHAPMKIDGCSLIATLRIMPHWPLDRLLASLFQAKKDP